MESMNDNMKRTLDNPEKFYWNVLSEEDDDTIPLSNTCIYLCVLLYLVVNLDENSLIIDKYINKYKYQLEKEIFTNKKSISDPEKNIFRQCEKFPIIRNLIYKEEREILLLCNSEEDYKNYLNTYGNLCREFTLFAKFRIAQISKLKENRFKEISEVINSFPNSDLFDIEYLKSLCVNINGISIYFTNDAAEMQKEAIIEILRDSICNYESKTYITSAPFSKLQIIKLLGFNVDILCHVINNVDGVCLLNIKDTMLLLSNLGGLTGLSWELPHNELIFDNNIFSNFKDIIWTKDCSSSDSLIYRYYALQPLIKLK